MYTSALTNVISYSTIVFVATLTYLLSRGSYYSYTLLVLPSFPPTQPTLEQPSEPDLTLASNLERQLLYSNRPSLFEAKPVSHLWHINRQISHNNVI